MRLETFDSLVRKAAPEVRTVKYNTLVTDATVYRGECFVRTRENLYVNRISLEPRGLSDYFYDDFFDNLRSLRNAWLYRMAVTDESLPAGLDDGAHLFLDRYPFFCRQSMIQDIGRIGYMPACPDLREAMLHDLRWEIRGAAAEALGRIGDGNYTADLIEVAREDRNPRVRHDAVDALGYMKDESALPALREMLQEGRRDIYLANLTQDRDRWNNGLDSIRDITRILMRIGGRAKDILKEFSEDPDFWVRWSVGKGREYSQLD